jgi:hypothetical protein
MRETFRHIHKFQKHHLGAELSRHAEAVSGFRAVSVASAASRLVGPSPV